ncbi:hypothetical protein [uncultured Streptomyces sp.]|uniref:hypothetical protein n=1 Tax=uncultured Streptomyces sp. TaxID=174707 RepID=UPI00262FB795|nr:hypothetical protein [uncultured Streptomyces sp.]
MSANLSFFRSETSERLRDEGRVEGQAEFLLFALEDRGITVSPEAAARIRACRDSDTLRHWFRRASTTNSTDDLFRDA